MTTNIKKILKNSNNIHKEILEDEEMGSFYRWENKEVIKKIELFTPNEDSLKNVVPPKVGQLILNNEFVYENDYSFEIKSSTMNLNSFSRSNSGIVINFAPVKMDNYNRINVYIYIKSTGYQNFYFHFKLGKNGVVNTASVTTNSWNRIIWELDDQIDREVDSLTVTPFLFGCPPEALKDVSFYIGKAVLDEVKLDHVLGWELDDRIAYCHSGYFYQSVKQAITQQVEDNKFYLLNENNEVVFENEIVNEKTKLGNYFILDFTKFEEKGLYKIKVDNRVTPLFEISSNPYMSSILKSINFLRMLRCGEDIEGVHSACHLNCKSVHENGNTVPNFGGWHDAGDVSQFEIPTAEMAHAILDLAINTKDKKIKERLLEEAKVGLNWLLRTRFNDGSRALAVHYSLWRQNELEKEDNTIYASVAEKGPFESFCSACALAVGSRCYGDPIFKSWCLRIAKEDFDYACEWYKQGIHTKRWGKNIDSQVCGHGILAACELYVATKDKHYIDIALEYSKKVLACQETECLENSNITGFFYEDIKHKYLLTYEHRGHEQSPIHGLCRLLQVYPKIKNREEIVKSIELYEKYVINTMEYTYPFNLLPGHVYNAKLINPERFTIPSYMCTFEEGIKDLNNQIKKGIKINEDWYLRIFPIAVQRRGYHATLLSKTKAISMIAKTLNKPKLKQIAISQLEWVLGKNPFASSTMYGEGHNYHPLYVAFSRQIVGSLPVGIETKGDLDLPYWPTHNNAVFKEIWGHTTGKYLWILADLI